MNCKKIIFVISFLVILGFMFNFGTPNAKAMAVPEIQILFQQIQQRIQQIQQQIIELQRQLDQMPPRPPAPVITSISPSSVRSNDMITIRGRNLRNTTVVAFSRGGAWNRKGSVEGQGITVLDESSLRFKFSELLDFRPGIYQVYVVNDHGRSNVLNFTVIVPTLPAPIITSVFPRSGMHDDKITIEGRNFRRLSGTIIEFSQDGILRGTIGRHNVVILSESSLSFKLSELLMRNMEGMGMYQIRVVNDHGRSNALDFTVVVPMPEVSIVPINRPIITSISPNSGRISDMVKILGSNLGDPATLSMLIIEFWQGNDLRGTIGRPLVTVLGESSITFELTRSLAAKIGGPGIYQVYVVNDHGGSNMLNFTIIQ